MVKHNLTRRDFLKRSLVGAAAVGTWALAKKSQPDSIPKKLNPNTQKLLQELLKPVQEKVVSSVRIQGINFKISYQHSRLILKTTILGKDFPRLTRALFKNPRNLPNDLQSYSIEFTFSVPVSASKVSNNIYLDKAKLKGSVLTKYIFGALGTMLALAFIDDAVRKHYPRLYEETNNRIKAFIENAL